MHFGLFLHVAKTMLSATSVDFLQDCQNRVRMGALAAMNKDFR
jgi:hypothetical protein